MGDLPLPHIVKHLVIFFTNNTHKSYKNYFLLCFAFFNKALHSRGTLCFWQMISRFAFFNFSPWPPPGCSSAPTKRKILVQYLSQKTCTCNFFISLGETLAVTSAIILWWTFFGFWPEQTPSLTSRAFLHFIWGYFLFRAKTSHIFKDLHLNFNKYELAMEIVVLFWLG